MKGLIFGICGFTMGVIGDVAVRKYYRVSNNEILENCDETLDKINAKLKEIRDNEELNNDEMAKLEKKVSEKLVNAFENISDGLSRNRFARQKCYKEALRKMKNIEINLTIRDYGWFYN